jgi:hypothetical protein
LFSTACDPVTITYIVSKLRPFSFILNWGYREKCQGAKSDEYTGWGTRVMLFLVKKIALSWCHNQFFVAKSRGEVFAQFHAIAVKHRSNMQNGLFGLRRTFSEICTELDVFFVESIAKSIRPDTRLQIKRT